MDLTFDEMIKGLSAIGISFDKIIEVATNKNGDDEDNEQ